MQLGAEVTLQTW